MLWTLTLTRAAACSSRTRRPAGCGGRPRSASRDCSNGAAILRARPSYGAHRLPARRLSRPDPCGIRHGRRRQALAVHQVQGPRPPALRAPPVTAMSPFSGAAQHPHQRAGSPVGSPGRTELRTSPCWWSPGDWAGHCRVADHSRRSTSLSCVPPGCVRLIWPHRDGLIWPHPHPQADS